MANTDDDIASILAALSDSDWRDRAWSVVGRWGDEPVDAHRRLCVALADRMRTNRSWNQDADDRRRGVFNTADMFDGLVDWLGTQPGLDAATILIDVCHHLAAKEAERTLRKVVANMPRTHSIEDVLEIFRRQDHRGVRQSWPVILHEYIAYGVDLSADETVTRYLAMVHDSGHPLGMLPARLLPNEPRTVLFPDEPQAQTSNPSKVAEAPPYVVPASLRRRARRSFETAVVRTGPRERRALLAPFRCWLDAEMNAGADVAVVHFDQAVAASDVDAGALGLLSIESMSGAKRPVVRRVSVGNACSFLQIQAAFGGPYGDGLGQAYGRLAMWQCIAALADVSRIGVRADPQVVPGDKVVQIMEAAEGCTWWRFHDTQWFTSPGFAPEWNTGLAVLRPNGQSLAITACRDQD